MYKNIILFVHVNVNPLSNMLNGSVKGTKNFCFTRGVLCKPGLLDDSEFGLDCSGLGGGWWWGWLWLHGDWGALPGQAVWGLDPTGVGRQCPCVVWRSWSTPETVEELRLIYTYIVALQTQTVY